MKNSKIKLTKKMKKDTDEFKRWFLDRTIRGRDIIDYEIGFSGVDILKVPSDHLHKGINKIFILDVGLNWNGTKIRKNIPADTTPKEARGLMNSIKYVLGQHYELD